MAQKAVQFGAGRGETPVVLATSAVNGLAYDSHQSWAFWRADGNALTGTPFRLHTGERATMAIVRSLDPRSFGVDRMCTLLQASLMHLEAPLAELAVGGRAEIFLAACEHVDEASDPYFGRWKHRLEQTAGSWLHQHGQAPAVRVFPRGHAGLAHAVIDAEATLLDGAIDLAIVGGVDSYYDPLRFDILEEQERIFDQSRPDSFIPGEGAAMLVLARESFARTAQATALARVEMASVAEEPAPMLGSELPCTGQGLTQALRGVTKALKAQARTIDWMLGDLTNEEYRARELVLAFPRAINPGGLDTAGRDYAEVVSPTFRGDQLPEVFGDLGAATMPTAAVLAVEAFTRGDPAARNCLITGSSTGRDRGVIFLRSASEGRR